MPETGLNRTIFRTTVIPILLGALVLSLGMLLSCGKAKEEEQQQTQRDTRYDNWERYTYGQFIVRFSPASPFLADKARLVQAFNNFLSEICSLLELPPPEQKIYLFAYAAPQDMETVAGRSDPFMNDTAIHWNGLTPYGYQLTKFVLEKNNIRPGNFQVAYEGIANLLDFSGVNYHRELTNMAGTDFYIPLRELGNDGIFSNMPVPIQRMESASLAGFIMYNYGSERLLTLAQSREGWETTIESLFQMDLEALEQDWLEFARAHGENPKRAGGKATP